MKINDIISRLIIMIIIMSIIQRNVCGLMDDIGFAGGMENRGDYKKKRKKTRRRN